MEPGQPDANTTKAARRRYLIAVVAEQEDDRALLSTAFSLHPLQRVTCSTTLDAAEDAVTRHPVDAIIGFIDAPGDWQRFRVLAERFPKVLSVLLVSDPDHFDGGADGRVLNAVVGMSRDDLVHHAADVATNTARTFGVQATTIGEADERDRRKLDELSDREREALALTAEGLAIKEIVRRLNRAYGTVASHRVRIMEKLGIHDKVALTRFAIRTGLIRA